MTTKFVPDTDPQLRSLLKAVQTADDPAPAVAALASWLDEREDPRSLTVRLSTEYWPFWQEGASSDAEAALWGRLRRECCPLVKEWLGVDATNADTIEFQLTTPLLHLSFGPFVAPRPELRALTQAGWVWFWKFKGRPDIDFWFHEPGPVRELCFEHNLTIRDDDLRRISQAPQLRWLDLTCPYVTDAGLAHLHRTHTLREVLLSHTGVTERGIAALREALPDCKISA